jgi:pimeloyl-ACP methyl ester carboxylesterase
MAHGFSGTSDWIVPDFAARFADGGLMSLIFDYRHLGLSEGEPRQLISSRRQSDDIRRAIEFVRRHPDIDSQRIALWGTSLGGSHVVNIAAEDPDIAAVVANVPALDMFKGLRGRSRPIGFGPTTTQVAVAFTRLLGAAAWDAARGLLGLSPHYIAVYGPLGRAVFADPALAPLFETLQAQAPLWRNRVTPRFLFTAPRYRDGTIARITGPLMVTVARDDAILSTSFIKRKAAQAHHVEIKEYPVGHFDVYHGAVRDQVVADHLSFLERHLSERRRPK